MDVYARMGGPMCDMGKDEPVEHAIPECEKYDRAEASIST